MAIYFKDLVFERINEYEPIEIELAEDLNWLQVKITIKRKWADDIVVAYDCCDVAWALQRWLDALIEVLPFYAAVDKYFNHYRCRTRCSHEGYSTGLWRWDLWSNYMLNVSLRNNFSSIEEEDDDYLVEREPEIIKQVIGDVKLCIAVQHSRWIAAIVKALDTLLLTCPNAADGDEDRRLTKEAFPHIQHRRLKAYLQIPDNPHKHDELKKLLGSDFPNERDFVVNPD